MNDFEVLVCYNNEKFFDQLNKNFKNIKIKGVNNKTNSYTIPHAYNHLTKTSNSKYIIYLHQDVVIPPNWMDIIIEQINLVENINMNWAVLGIMGVTKHGFFAGNIVDPHTNTRMGNLPCEVASLDEVCLIMRKDSKLRFDESLGGFHLYGADICLQAQHSNLKCYAVDAPFEHLSGGRIDNTFLEISEKLKMKWSQIKDSPYTIETTCGVFQLKKEIRASLSCYYKEMRRKLVRRLQGRHKRLFNA